MASTSNPCGPGASDATYSGATVTLVAEPGSVTWKSSPTMTWYPVITIGSFGNPGGGAVTGVQLMRKRLLAPIVTETCGPSGMACVNSHSPSISSSSTVRPSNSYVPSGKRSRSSSSGNSSSDGSAPSKNSSVKPSCLNGPLPLTSKSVLPSGSMILTFFQSSPSRLTCTPRSLAEELYSQWICEISSGTSPPALVFMGLDAMGRAMAPTRKVAAPRPSTAAASWNESLRFIGDCPREGLQELQDHPGRKTRARDYGQMMAAPRLRLVLARTRVRHLASDA